MPSVLGGSPIYKPNPFSETTESFFPEGAGIIW